MRRAQVGLALALLALLPCALRADQPDGVQLTNGDHLTGSLGKLERGQLSFSAEGGGAIDLPWKSVAQLRSSRQFEVEMGSGRTYTGTLASPADGRVEVTGAGGSQVLELAQIVRLEPEAANFRAHTSGSLDLGLTMVSPAKVLGSYGLDGEATHHRRAATITATLNSLLVRSGGEVTETRNFFNMDGRWLLPQRWFAIGMFELQNDQLLDLDFRGVFGGGAGRMLVQSDSNEFSLYGGADYNRERYAEPHATDNTAEAMGGLDWRWFPSHGAELDTVAQTYLSLTRARVRVELDSELREYVFRKLYWGFTVFESFDSDPMEDRLRSNFGTEITLGWKF